MAKIEILIVDDSPAFNHLTRLAFTRAGIDHNVTEQSNGQKALDYLAQSTTFPDVILLDINMPVMDGFDFLDEYTRTFRHQNNTDIYMLTSSSQDVDRIKVKSFGIVKDYFEKPLSRENLAIIVGNLD